MGDGDGDLGGEGIWGEMGIQGWRGDVGVVETGIWRWGSLPISPSKDSCGREGELVLQENPHVVVCPCFSLDL